MKQNDSPNNSYKLTRRGFLEAIAGGIGAGACLLTASSLGLAEPAADSARDLLLFIDYKSEAKKFKTLLEQHIAMQINLSRLSRGIYQTKEEISRLEQISLGNETELPKIEPTEETAEIPLEIKGDEQFKEIPIVKYAVEQKTGVITLTTGQIRIDFSGGKKEYKVEAVYSPIRGIIDYRITEQTYFSNGRAEKRTIVDKNADGMQIDNTYGLEYFELDDQPRISFGYSPFEPSPDKDTVYAANRTLLGMISNISPFIKVNIDDMKRQETDLRSLQAKLTKEYTAKKKQAAKAKEQQFWGTSIKQEVTLQDFANRQLNREGFTQLIQLVSSVKDYNILVKLKQMKYTGNQQICRRIESERYSRSPFTVHNSNSAVCDDMVTYFSAFFAGKEGYSLYLASVNEDNNPNIHIITVFQDPRNKWGYACREGIGSPAFRDMERAISDYAERILQTNPATRLNFQKSHRLEFGEWIFNDELTRRLLETV